MKKAGMILLSIIIVVFNFIIGANEKGLRVIAISILFSLTTIYLLIKKIRNRKNSILFKSTIDIFVLVFALTTLLPLIFKTYCSYSDTIEFFIKYMFYYSVYVLARNCIEDKKDVNIIISIILIGSLIPILIGLDHMKTHFCDQIIETLKLKYDETSMFSATFGYANAVAIYMSLCIFLALHKVKNSEKKTVKVISVLYILFAIYIVWITISRSIIAILALSMIMYLAFDNRKNIKKNWKKIAIISGIIVIIVTPAMMFALKKSEPFVPSKNYYDRMKYSFKPNTDYKIEIDVTAKASSELLYNNAFRFDVIEANKYFFERVAYSKEFGDLDGIVTLEFKTSDEVGYVNLKLINDFNGKITINKCYINGEEYILNFKYLPNSIGKMFSEFSLSEKSLKERKYIYSDCIKLVKQSPIIGQGGNTWKVLSPTVHEYGTQLKESHSYLAELMISYGFVGAISFLTILIVMYYKLIKQFKNNKDALNYKLPIIAGITLLIMHSLLFDFNMSFMLIQILVYIAIAMIISDIDDDIKVPSVIDFIIIGGLLIIISILIRADIAQYLIENKKIKYDICDYNKAIAYYYLKENEKNKEVLDEIVSYLTREPYTNQTEMYNMYFKNVCFNFEKLENDQIEKYLNFGINRLKTIKFNRPLEPKRIIERTTIISNTINKIEEYRDKTDEEDLKEMLDNKARELKQIIEAEKDTHLKNIKDNARTGYSDAFTSKYKEEYLKIINLEET